MKKYSFALLFIIFFSLKSSAQETREMTPSEITFHQRIVNLIFDALPQLDLNDWTLVSQKDREFDKRIGITHKKDQGIYAYDHEFVYNRPFEKTQLLLEEITKKMEGVTDNNKIIAFSKSLQEVTLNAEMRIRVSINSEHSAFADCSGTVKYPSFLDKDYHWGVNILHAAQVPTSDNKSGVCKNETRIILGKSNPFKLFKYDSDQGGNVVSAIKLPVETGQNAFKIHNIVISVEADPKDALSYLKKVNWKLINDQLSK